jgi:hypothetical protein
LVHKLFCFLKAHNQGLIKILAGFLFIVLSQKNGTPVKKAPSVVGILFQANVEFRQSTA